MQTEMTFLQKPTPSSWFNHGFYGPDEGPKKRGHHVRIFWALVWPLKLTTRGHFLQKCHFSHATTFASKLGTPYFKFNVISMDRHCAHVNRNEGDDFCDILLTNENFWILVKVLTLQLFTCAKNHVGY
jgi:hypothetical protein